MTETYKESLLYNCVCLSAVERLPFKPSAASESLSQSLANHIHSPARCTRCDSWHVGATDQGFLGKAGNDSSVQPDTHYITRQLEKVLLGDSAASFCFQCKLPSNNRIRTSRDQKGQLHKQAGLGWATTMSGKTTNTHWLCSRCQSITLPPASIPEKCCVNTATTVVAHARNPWWTSTQSNTHQTWGEACCVTDSSNQPGRCPAVRASAPPSTNTALDFFFNGRISFGLMGWGKGQKVVVPAKSGSLHERVRACPPALPF